MRPRRVFNNTVQFTLVPIVNPGFDVISISFLLLNYLDYIGPVLVATQKIAHINLNDFGHESFFLWSFQIKVVQGFKNF